MYVCMYVYILLASSLSLFPSLSVSCLLGAYTDFLSGGLSIWRAVFLSIFSFSFW